MGVGGRQLDPSSPHRPGAGAWAVCSRNSDPGLTAAGSPGRTRRGRKPHCQLSELKVTDQPKVPHRWSSETQQLLPHLCLAEEIPLRPGRRAPGPPLPPTCVVTRTGTNIPVPPGPRCHACPWTSDLPRHQGIVHPNGTRACDPQEGAKLSPPLGRGREKPSPREAGRPAGATSRTQTLQGPRALTTTSDAGTAHDCRQCLTQSGLN